MCLSFNAFFATHSTYVGLRVSWIEIITFVLALNLLLVKEIFLLHGLRHGLLIILNLLMLYLRDIRSFQKHPGVVDCNGVTKSNINDDAHLLVWLEGNLSSLLLGFQDYARHVNVECLLVQVTCDLDLYFLRGLVRLGPNAPLLLVEIVDICFINSVLDGNENTFDSIVSYISIHDKSQLLLFIFT